MTEQLNRRNFLKKTLAGTAGVTALGIGLAHRPLQAQEDEFNTRVIQGHVYAMHLYRDKLLNDKCRPTYHFVIPEGIVSMSSHLPITGR